MAEKKEVDWKAVELEYRAGILTLRAMASKYGVSHVAIDKRAKRDGWTRDLKERIRAKAEEKVNRDAVTNPVNKENERVVIEANALLQADVIRSHRKDVTKARELVNRLLSEVSAKSLTPGELATLNDCAALLAENPDDNKVQSEVFGAFMKSIDIGDRVDATKKLADAMVKLVQMERVIFGITNESAAESVEDRMLRAAADGV